MQGQEAVTKGSAPKAAVVDDGEMDSMVDVQVVDEGTRVRCGVVVGWRKCVCGGVTEELNEGWSTQLRPCSHQGSGTAPYRSRSLDASRNSLEEWGVAVYRCLLPGLAHLLETMTFQGAAMAKDCVSESTRSNDPHPIACTFIEALQREQHVCGHRLERTRGLDEAWPC